MRINLHPPTPRGVRRVMKTLDRMAARRDHVLDLTPVREELRRLVDTMAPEHLDDAVLAAIDSYVDSYVSDFLREMYERHSAQLNDLDQLEIRVRPYLARAGVLDHDDQSRLVDLQGAVTHALDRLSDPDRPLVDPIPRQRRGEHRP